MTDKEKAKLLTPCVYCSRICKVHGVDGVEPCNTYYSLIEMAEWKEDDLFQWMRENLNNYLSVGNTDYGCFDWYVDWDEMIKDYKKHNEQE